MATGRGSKGIALRLAALAALAAGATGCLASTAVVAHKRDAYVIKGTVFGTSMYYCTVESGKPVCTEVTQHAEGE